MRIFIFGTNVSSTLHAFLSISRGIKFYWSISNWYIWFNHFFWLNFVSELTFELLVQIVLYKDQDNDNSFQIISFFQLCLSLMLGKLIQNNNQQTDSTYRDSHPTNISNLLWRLILVCCDRTIELIFITYTTHKENKILRLKEGRTNYKVANRKSISRGEN